MAYFSKQFITFFAELEKNNNREWFLANKKTYENEVKKKFELFVNDLIMKVKQDDPEVNMSAKEAIFRINRDIRFSQDKSPYKINVSAAISSGGKKDFISPGIYIELSPKGIGIYGGIYMPEKETLYKIREYLAKHDDEFKKVISNKDFVKHFGTIQGEVNKKIQPEFKEALVKQPLIANKQFYYMCELDKKLITDDALMDEIWNKYLASKPVKDFLTKAVRS